MKSLVLCKFQETDTTLAENMSYSNKTASEEYVWQPSLSLDLMENSFFLEDLFSYLKSVIVK